MTSERGLIEDVIAMRAPGVGDRSVWNALRGKYPGLTRSRVRTIWMNAPTGQALSPAYAALSHYDAACRALAEAKDLSEVMEINNKAAALQEYYRRANNKDLQIDAAEIRVLAEVKAGEMLLAMKADEALHEGGRPRKTGSDSEPVSSDKQRLAEMGIDKKFSSRAQRLASISERALKARLAVWRSDMVRGAGRVTVDLLRDGDKRERRAARESHLGEMQAAANLKLPDKRYGVIQGDPQWGRTVYSRATGMDRHAANHYPTANGDEVTQDDAIKALGVAAIAAPDCVLGLWCTEPWRGEAVLKAWGFEPKAYFVWVKDIVADVPEGIGNGIGMLRSGQRLSVVGTAGMGFWNRDRCEIMLIGVRGKPVCPAPGTQGERVWFARRGEHAVTRDDIHSDKPNCSFEWFERHWPNTPKIELNARRARPGWDCWGLDAPIDAPPHDPETGEVTPSTSAQEAAE